MCDRRRPIESTFFFHLLYDVFQSFLLILIQLQAVHDQLISLCQLCRCKTDRDSCCLCMILDQMHDCMKASMNSTSVFICITEIYDPWFLLVFRNVKRMLYQFVNTLVLGCRDRYDRNSKHFLHAIDQNRASILSHLVHHVQCKAHRHIQLHQLHGQIKVSFYISSINDIDDSLRVLIQDKIPRYDLFAGIR